MLGWFNLLSFSIFCFWVGQNLVFGILKNWNISSANSIFVTLCSTLLYFFSDYIKKVEQSSSDGKEGKIVFTVYLKVIYW